MASLFNYFNQMFTIIPLFQCLVSSHQLEEIIGQLNLLMPILVYVIYTPKCPSLAQILAVITTDQLETLPCRAQQTVEIYK